MRAHIPPPATTILALMGSQYLVHIFKILKKWLSRLARRPVSMLFSLLSLLRRFAAGYSGLRGRGPVIGSHSPPGFLMRSQGNVAGDDVLVYPSHLPLDRTSLEVARGRPSHSDVPYLGQGAGIPSSETATTAKACSVVVESNPFSSSSVSSLHPPRHTGESYSTSPRNRYDQKGRGIDSSASDRASASPGPSILEISSMISDISTRTSRSNAPSLVVPEDRRFEYRKLVGSGHIPGSTRNSTANLPHASLYGVSVLPYLPVQAVPARSAAPPASDGQPGSEVATLYDAPDIHELVPKQIKRYHRETRLPGISNTSIPANTSTFPVHDMPVPDGWTSVVHPEGSRYFVNQEKRILTESNICDSILHEQIEYGIEVLLGWLEPEGLDIRQVDLLIELQRDENDKVVFSYYFANHQSRCIFWLDKFDAKDVLEDCECVRSLSHKGLAIQAQYWRHWDYFPSLCPVSQNLVDEVNDMLMHAKCDHLSSKQSSAPYDIASITDYISVVDRIKVSPADQNNGRCHAAIVIGRIMCEFSRSAFINFHGEDCVRLSFDQTVHGWKYKPSLWMVIFTPILFLEPVIYVQELHKIFADKIARTSRWNAFSSRLKGQLQNSNLLATVLLNANVALLGLIKGGSFIQMTSYMSLVTSFGSIVLGLFFVSQDRTSGQSTAEEAASFLIQLHDKKHGLESLAMIYSFPKALLMWGMVFFFVAFSMNWYTPGVTAPKLVVGIVTLFVFVMITVSIMRTKERHHWWPMTLELLSDMANALKPGKEVIDNERSQRDAEEMELNPMVPPEVNLAADDPTHSTIVPHFPTFPTPAHLHQQRNDSNSMLHSPYSCTSRSLLLGESYSLQNREDTPTSFQVQPTGEARGEAEPGRSSSAVHETLHSSGIQRMTVISSERNQQSTAVAMDSSAAIVPPGLLRAEESKKVGRMSEEPEEVKIPQAEDRTTPLLTFRGRGPTGDNFHYALQTDGQDIIETRDE